MPCWDQLNGTTGFDNWTRATTYAWDNGDTNATAVACFFDRAVKSDIARDQLNSNVPANLASATLTGCLPDNFAIAEPLSGTSGKLYDDISVTASAQRVDRDGSR